MTDHGALEVASWYCEFCAPPLRLGTVEERRILHLKVRDRYYHITGRGATVTATCPRGGCESALSLPVTERGAR